MRTITTIAVALTLGVGVLAQTQQAPAPAADPVFVIETQKGTVEIRLFQADAPKSVAHIVGLVRQSFYRAQRIHRATPSLVQFGDQQSRDMSRKAYWGRAGSGRPINAFELVKKYSHRRGMVGLAHSGNPMAADSQLYIMKQPSPGLDGKHAIIGQVVAGMGIVDKLAVADVLKQAYIKGEGPK